MSDDPVTKKLKDLAWRVVKKTFNLRHIRQTPKLGDVNDKKFLTSTGNLNAEKSKAIIDENIKLLTIIAGKMTTSAQILKGERKAESPEVEAERIAIALTNDNNFLYSLRDIFTDSFLRIPDSFVPEVEEDEDSEDSLEDAIDKELEMSDEEVSEDNTLPKEISALYEGKETTFKTQVRKLPKETDDKYKKRLKVLNRFNWTDYDDSENYMSDLKKASELIKKAPEKKVIPTNKLEGFDLGLDLLASLKETATKPDEPISEVKQLEIKNEELKRELTKRNKPKLTLALPKIKPVTKAEDDMRKLAISTNKKVGELSTNVLKAISKNVYLDRKYKAIDSKLRDTVISDNQTKNLSDSQINQLIDNIPEEYRNTLSSSVRGLLGGNKISANDMAIAVLGLSLIPVVGPMGATMASEAANYMLNRFGINLNDYVFSQETVIDPEFELDLEEEKLPTPSLNPEEKKLTTPSLKPPGATMRARAKLPQPKPTRTITVKKALPKTSRSKQRRLVPPLIKPQTEIKPQSGKNDDGWMGYGTIMALDETTSSLKNWLDIYKSKYENARTVIAQQYYERRLEEYDNRIAEQNQDPRSSLQKLKDLRDGKEYKHSKTSGSDSGELPGGDDAQYESLLRRLYNSVSQVVTGSATVINNIVRDMIPQMERPLILQLLSEGIEPLSNPKMFDLIGESRDRVMRGVPGISKMPKIPRLPKPDLKRQDQPRRGDLETGTRVGTVTGALGAALGSGTMSAQAALGSVITGAAGAAATSYLSITALRNIYRRRGINPDEPSTRKKINYLATIPAAIAAASLGYSGLSEGITSGAGITEKKINIDNALLNNTQAQLDQEGGKNKIWQPKSISPTTSILDESQQEKYADDLEFIAFNYIPPTSEGAQGTVATNPLKYQQQQQEKIRYTDAGVFIPYTTWNEINNANDISEQRIREMTLGQEPLITIPEMTFIDMDNETTFENVNNVHYVNNELTSIEFKSPYSDYSNVDNNWWTNEDNILFTVNP